MEARRISQLLLRCRGLFSWWDGALVQYSKPTIGPYASLNPATFYNLARTHVVGGYNTGGCSRIQNKSFSSAASYVTRNLAFSVLNSDDIGHFKEILGDRNVIQDEERLSAANLDWMQKYRGSSKLLLLPRNTDQVSKILEYCNSRKLAIVPQGGNTGLVGGNVPVYDEVIIYRASMDKIIYCEGGCILENLNSFLVNEGYNVPEFGII